MTTIRRIFRRRVILALIAWTVLVLLVQTFKGSSVGSPFACAQDPTCGEIGWIPTAAWIGGLIVILAVGWATRRR